MKGLLLKDLYMMKAYCKSYILIIAVFLAASYLGGNTFFIYYPCLMSGMIPVTLLAYDERDRFLQYSASLPVSRTQFVSEKYLLSLLTQGAVLLIIGIVQGIRMSSSGTFARDEFTVMMFSLLTVSMLGSSVPLPLIFRNGVEKGRIGYYIMIGIGCGAAILFTDVFKGEIKKDIPMGTIFGIVMIAGIGLYLLSWYLSVRFYKKREL